MRGRSNRALALLRAFPGMFRSAFCIFLISFPIVAGLPLQAAVRLLDTYYSPKNAERPVRPSTKFIILHTTEGPSRGSGSKLKKNGEAHYMVDEAGRVYRIIDRKRVAYHCGRSMWNGLSSLDNCSVGIEVVGYHNKDLTAAQYKALKELVAELKKAYRIPDDKVLTHSMVAYGAPNQWHKRSHRGRKRCGMRMALPSVRKKLGLNSKPAFDPDVKAGRLVVADRELQQLLYSVERNARGGNGGRAKPQPGKTGGKTGGPVIANPKPNAPGKDGGDATEGLLIGLGQSAWDVARGAYNAHTTVYVFPNGERRRGDEIKNWKAIRSGTRVLLNVKDGGKAKETASKAAGAGSPAADRPQAHETRPVPAEETLDEAAAVSAYEAREASGNVIGPGKSAWDIARDAYAASTTIYDFPNGERRRGSEIRNWKAIPPGTRVTVAEGDVNEPEPISSLGDAAAADAAGGSTTHRPEALAAPPSSPAASSPEAEPAPQSGQAQPPPGASTAQFAGEVLQTTPPRIAVPLLATIAGAEWNSERTIYVTEKGRVIKGSELDADSLALLTPQTKVFSGYRIGGPVSAKNPAFAICGPIWRDEGTQFLFPDGHIESGDRIDPRKIPPKTMILYKD